MSRKRPHEEDFQDNLYLLPGCYTTTCSCSQQENGNEYYNFLDPLLIEEHTFTGDGLYVADSYGNIFYTNYVSYLCCEDIVRCADAQMETDDLSDPEAGRESKKNRFSISSEDEETSACESKQEISSYTVEEPPDEDADNVPEASKEC